ncbi:hypothetical protein [Micromonospora sp. NPDC023814]|uniref:hypothetical protein n=1 Tax=Micromonospora sp. NPDC023814 TaxID=3154596 RepID=UPI0033EF6F40
MILDLYAGAGGWDRGASTLGLDTVGLEIWHDACVTAVRAGHPRIRCDIATYPTAPLAGKTACDSGTTVDNRLGELSEDGGQDQTIATLTALRIAPSRLCGHCFSARIRHTYKTRCAA